MARQDIMVNLFMQTFIITSLNSVRSEANIEAQKGCENLHSSSINSDDNYCSAYSEAKSGTKNVCMNILIALF